MELNNKLSRIKEIFNSRIGGAGYSLVDINASWLGRRLNIRIAVDRKEGGITLNECADISRRLSSILDGEDFIQESYVLEVSSPGVDRPLLTEDDFRRNINRNLVVYYQDADKPHQAEGVLVGVTDSEIVIASKGQEVKIDLEKVRKAKQVV